MFENQKIDNLTTCFFTGIGELPDRRQSRFLIDALLDAIHDYISMGYNTFIYTSGVGFEMLAAELVLFLRNSTQPHLKLYTVQPYQSFDARMSESDRKRITVIYSQADVQAFFQKRYASGYWAKLAKEVVGISNGCIQYFDKDVPSIPKNIAGSFQEKFYKKGGCGDVRNLYPLVAERCRRDSRDFRFYDLLWQSITPAQINALAQAKYSAEADN